MKGGKVLSCCQRLALLPRHCPRQSGPLDSISRSYATNHAHQSSSFLSHSLDTKRDDFHRADSVGPFQLGLGQPTLKKGERMKKWSELSAGGKVLRTTARTTNLTVILLGAGLSALLVYSLTSELFSRNSPTVIYGDACERIRASSKVAKLLRGPLSFHNQPPSTIRPRHRNRHVISQIMVDQYGQEHMIMTFYVEGCPPGSELANSDSSYLEDARQWVRDSLSNVSDLTLDDSIAWTRGRAEQLWGEAKSIFKYLSGSPIQPSTSSSFPPTVEPAKGEGAGAWSFTGMFSSLRGPNNTNSQSKQRGEGRTFTDGQVHAHLVRNQDGYFVFRYLLIDLPSSRDPNPVRVFVERTPGVRENEPVMKWKSDS